MSEFTEKLNSSKLVSNAWDEIDKDQANAGLLIDTISNEFKDWQPPRKLVEVPQIMADFIEERKEELTLYGALREIDEHNDAEVSNWVFQKSDGQSLFAKAWIDGYTVKKEQMFILKHIDLSKLSADYSLYLSNGVYPKLQHARYSEDTDMSKVKNCHFTQSEIDELNIGSYEKIAVKVEED